MIGIVSVHSELKNGEREESRILSGFDKAGGYGHPVSMLGKYSSVLGGGAKIPISKEILLASLCSEHFLYRGNSIAPHVGGT